MDFSSLSKGQVSLDIRKRDPGLSPRAVRILRDLTLVVAIVVLLYGLRAMSAAIESETRHASPLPFDLVMERFGRVQMFAPRKEVEELLGPPSNRVDVPVNLMDHLELADLSHRGLPKGRTWQTWSDPEDPGKCIAILFADDKVYRKLKHGF